MHTVLLYQHLLVVSMVEGGIFVLFSKEDKSTLINTKSGVTKSQVGLGNVPNVATNDQTPTYTTASSLAKLSSGEKMSVAMGKMAKSVSSAIYIVSFDAETGTLVTKSIDYNE